MCTFLSLTAPHLLLPHPHRLHSPLSQVDMVTLAEQIIEATPDRIKQDDFTASDSAPLRERSGNLSKTMAWLASYLDTADQMPGLPPHGSVLSTWIPSGFVFVCVFILAKFRHFLNFL